MSDFSEMSVMKMIFLNWNSLNFLMALFPYQKTHKNMGMLQKKIIPN